MKRRMLASLLSLAILLGLMPLAPVYAADSATEALAGGAEITPADGWFYKQLTVRARKIYDALESAYKNGGMKDGTAPVPLDNVVDFTEVEAYIQGNRTLFNDFASAKDAFDLEHPEAWYIDSSKLALTAERAAAYADAKASIGVGYTDTYYVDGVTASSDVAARTEKLDIAVKTIVSAANAEFTTDAEKVRYVHDEIIHSISYRFEYQCSSVENAGFIRTAYALVTHEGVCEGYARSFQYVLNELGIPCVLIHGVQMSGEPENHMWCAVYLDGGWYVVDPTWDDPVVVSGKSASKPGEDGGERNTYCLVGMNVVGADWVPSGYVSTGAMEFAYPEIAPRAYGSGLIESNGLVVTYDEDKMEDIKSTVYRVSYNGKGLAESAKDGYYFLVRLYDTNADGSVDSFSDWYYPVHGLLALGSGPEDFHPEGPFYNTGNPYYYDTDEYMVQNVANCEYVEFAVTNIAPYWKNANDLVLVGGYLEDHGGSEADIVAQTGLIYNPNGNYEQRPHVKNVTPITNTPVYVGSTYTIHMEFTDPLFHPDDEAIKRSEALGKVNEARAVQNERVTLDYTGTNYSWGVNGKLPHQFSVKPLPQNVRWECTGHGAVHEDMARIDADCRLTTLEFEFTPSKMWADDSVSYEFCLTGLVGVKSNKRPAMDGMAFVFENQSAYCALRCAYGIDWNLWGQPQLLDNPNNLDFDKMKVEGIDGKEQSIKDLYSSMNLDDYDMNGRLLLVVENVTSSQARGQEMAGMLAENGVNLYDSESVLASMLYEIDFARICSKTIVKTGDSLRMQVGFPAGFDASNLAGTVFKVYHFIKEDGEITGVEEIPVTVTPYGLVFQVSSFSPFAIVAEAAKEGAADSSKTVVLAAEGHGEITADYKPGEKEVKGTVKFAPGESHTFTITPELGCVLENITFSGLANGLTYNKDKGNYTFTLSYDDIADTNAIIGVSFAKGAAENVTVTGLCNHENTQTVPEEGKKAKAATCTENGYILKAVCTDCGQVVSNSKVIPATGHAYDSKSSIYTAPTCEQDGKAVLNCKVKGCGSETIEIVFPALGHDRVNGVCVREVCDDKYTITFNANGGTFGDEGNPTAGQVVRQVNKGAKLNRGNWPAATRDGHTFAGWYTAAEGGDPVATETVFTADTTVYAHWIEKPSPKTYAITVAASSAEGGTVSGGGDYLEGSSVTVTASPNSGYRFVGWTENGTTVSTSATYTFEVEADRTLTAVFKYISGGGGSTPSNPSYQITVSAVSNGTVTVSHTSAKSGTKVTITVTPDDGYTIDSITVTDSTGRSISVTDNGDGICTFAMPASTVTVTATFVKSSYGTAVSEKTVNGTIELDTETAQEGATVTITSRANKGYISAAPIVTDKSGNAVAVTKNENGMYSFVMPVGGVTVTGCYITPAQMFSDVRDDAWYSVELAFAVEHGLIVGYDGKFDPSTPTTRGMLVTLLYNLEGRPDAPDSNPFTDVPAGRYYTDAVAWAAANGIVAGYNDNTFGPNDEITREQMAAVLYNYAFYKGYDGSERADLSNYDDAGAIHSWAMAGMSWAKGLGLITGRTTTTLVPNGASKRVEAAVLLAKFCQLVIGME